MPDWVSNEELETAILFYRLKNADIRFPMFLGLPGLSRSLRLPDKDQCLHFIECLTQNNRPFTDGQSGLEVVQVMEAINRSLEQNGTPVQLR